LTFTSCTRISSEQEHVNALSFTAHVPLLRHEMFEHGVSEKKNLKLEIDVKYIHPFEMTLLE